jgi:hypothetical protein
MKVVYINGIYTLLGDKLLQKPSNTHLSARNVLVSCLITDGAGGKNPLLSVFGSSSLKEKPKSEITYTVYKM